MFKLLTVPSAVETVNDIVAAITGAMPITTIMLIIAAVIGSALGFVLAWFGVRYAAPRILQAIKTGSFRV